MTRPDAAARERGFVPRWAGRRAVYAAVSLAGLVGLALAGFLGVRSRVGVSFSSDTYSYLVWARRALEQGELGHTPYDFTAPKPLELLIATIGELMGAPVAFFGSWAMLSFLLAVVAAAALAGRIAGPPAAVAAGILALALPALVLQGYAADSTVPFAACVVGAAAVGPRRPVAAAILLGFGGLLRPEAWGLAALHTVLSWARASFRQRATAVASAVVPPAIWITFDWIATGDPLYGAHAVERFGVRKVPAGEVPGVVKHLVPRVAGWPLVALAAAALVLGLRRRPLDPAVVFPVALAFGLLAELHLGLVGARPLGRYGLGLFLFLPAGAAAVLGSIPGRTRFAALGLGVGLCVAFVAGELGDIRDFHERRGATAGELERKMGAATRRAAAAGGLVATEPQWQGALSLYGRVPRERIVPVGEVGTNVRPEQVRAYLVQVRLQAKREGPVAALREQRPVERSTRWRLYFPSSPLR